MIGSCTLAAGGLEPQDYAPLPDTLVAARSIYLINDSGDLKAFDTFYRELSKWGRFTVVTSRGAADIVAVLTSSATYTFTIGSATAIATGNVTTATGSAVSVPSKDLHVKIFEAREGEQLWSDSTAKWVTSGHAPSKLVDNLKKRMPKIR